MDIGFEGGIAAGIEDFASVDGCDGGVVHWSVVMDDFFRLSSGWKQDSC
jgi:hypothetical protein